MTASYLQLLAAVAPILVVMLGGFAVRKIGWLSVEADRSLLSVVVNLLTPCLIFDNVVGNAALRNIGTVLLAPALGFATVLFGFAAGLLTSRVIRCQNPDVRRTFAMTTGLYNYAYIPLPLIASLFDTATLGVLFLFNLGVEFALWTAGVTLLSGSRSGGWRKALNPPVGAIVLAVALNFLGGRTFVPTVAGETIRLLAGAAIPMGLLLTGATLADLFRPQVFWTGKLLSIAAVVLRGGITPWAFVLLAASIPMPIELQRVLIIQGAMPAAVVPLILTRVYGGDTPTVLRTVVATTLFGIVTIPLWLHFGFHLLSIR